jgi:coenzyme PQQ precursor peptide PqqA
VAKRVDAVGAASIVRLALVDKAIAFFPRRTAMQWTTPSYTDMRFGFEITMYIATR